MSHLSVDTFFEFAVVENFAFAVRITIVRISYTITNYNSTYLLYKPIYSQFYVQIANFSLPLQQGSVGGQFK